MGDYGLRGKTVVVTGGASGIGKATALGLAERGAHVGIVDLRDEDIAPFVGELKALGVRAFGVAADVADEAAMAKAANAIFEALGDVDGLVTCAGTAGNGKAEDFPIAEWHRIMDVNVLGTFMACQLFGRPMIDRKQGSIVCIGSLAGMGAHAGRLAYSASKFAVHGVVKGLALEWARHNIRVNCIAPSIIATPMAERALPQYFLDSIVDRTPAGRVGQAEDIAAMVLMLLSDAAPYVNGVVLPVDGALTAGYFTQRSGADLQSKRLLDAGVYEN
ncbi:3-oxoacyl-(acyl-carrier-protein) reductase [Sphingobium chlorophenolicum L-1]|uniref:3-oxoacyl-(Acyl-carrier-protein) reductase n=1 Tax=Sphingobium chlorophenolicum L-1 TaxID=690566 RepID=F6F1N2_SPHCR|nr:SDR family NAD(P)-dependent oxidoreductase [Sphingobium chlorophenolicum]AEG51448.1 3-oxoacyl-(acyl-carrier-protein) reductase [Sphingobium chlorophenolicum L-1]